MSTNLIRYAPSVYDRIDPDKFIPAVGQAIAQSGIFGPTSPATGIVIALECAAQRCSPFDLARRYHVIESKLSMRADAMLAKFRQRGGRHRIIRRDSECAAVELSLDGETVVFALTFEEAKDEPFVWSKVKELKKNYATPLSRMQMLWARVVSDGVRTMAPEVVAGSYTPEEVVDFTDSNVKLPADTPVDAEFTKQQIIEAAVQQLPPEVQQTVDRQALDKFVDDAVASNLASGTGSPTAAPAVPVLEIPEAEQLITSEQLKELATLRDQCGWNTNEWKTQLIARFGVETARALRQRDAMTLKVEMEKLVESKAMASDLDNAANALAGAGKK